ncbi:MAG TPA: class I adenylate-forming enzyme family protein [Acidimicrobiales bacterium]|nr:class I adenylate-forming enzyme family protein [Acidimicrobiales bacterium]
MQVYKDRMKALRQIPEISIGRGDQVFIVHGERELNFHDFVALSNSVSYGFQAHDVGHGDRVAVLSQNNPEWCMSFWGAVNIGAILVGLNGWWTTDEIVYGLQDSGSHVLIADAKRFERVAEHLDDCPDLEHVFLIDADPSDFGDDKRLHRFDELTGAPTDALPTVPIDEDDYAVIFYTSGTTGRPKGAISTHRSMVANLQNTMYNGVAGQMTGGGAIPQNAGQTVALFTSPLFHVSGCHSTLVVGMLAGLKLVMIEGRFEPQKALELIQDHGVTLWATVPTMVWRVCEEPSRHDYDTSTVQSVAFGGSPSADELQRKVRETFPNVKTTTNAYGLTESSSVATAIGGQDAIDKPNSVGPPVPTLELKIRDEHGHEVPTGQTGEVTMYGPLIMAGYWNKPDATADTVRDGWLYTGDIGYVDADGFLYITDRKKDMIIRGGENIYCVEIENRLVENPAIADAAVIGVPHPELGEEVKAVVQLEPGYTLTEDDVRAWVRETLANFKVPAYVEIRTDKLPRNASGKLLKNVLRGEGEVSFAETM